MLLWNCRVFQQTSMALNSIHQRSPTNLSCGHSFMNSHQLNSINHVLFSQFSGVRKTQSPIFNWQCGLERHFVLHEGENWYFNSLADWDVVNSSTMLKGCHDEDVHLFLEKEILGKQIVQISAPVDRPSCDPIFVLSNNLSIKPSDQQWVL